MNKFLIWGGVGVAALAGGFLLLRGGASPAPAQDSGSGAYYPATVYGSGGGSVATDTSGASTDNSIASLIAGNLAIAQEQSSATKYTSDNLKTTQLAQISSAQAIAFNDNAVTLDTNKKNVQVALAGQLGDIIKNMTGGKQVGSVGGSLGFDSNGKLSLGVATGGGLAKAPTLTELKTYVS